MVAVVEYIVQIVLVKEIVYLSEIPLTEVTVDMMNIHREMVVLDMVGDYIASTAKL